LASKFKLASKWPLNASDRLGSPLIAIGAGKGHPHGMSDLHASAHHGAPLLSHTGKGHPHGMGELLLLDGSAHVGMFVHGAAHGDGVYYDCKGSVHSGAWDGNKRVGRFEVR